MANKRRDAATGNQIVVMAAVGLIALAVGCGIGFVYGHEKKKAINDVEAADGRKAREELRELKAAREQEIEHLKSQVANLTRDLDETRLLVAAAKPVDAKPPAAKPPMVVPGVQVVAKPKAAQIPTTFEDCWTETVGLAKKAIANEPTETAKAIKLLGDKDAFDVSEYAKQIRSRERMHPETISRLSGLNMSSLVDRFHLQMNVMGTANGTEWTDYKGFAGALWNPEVTPEKQFQHAKSFDCNGPWTIELNAVLIQGNAAAETKTLNLIRSFPGGAKWLETKYKK